MSMFCVFVKRSRKPINYFSFSIHSLFFADCYLEVLFYLSSMDNYSHFLFLIQLHVHFTWGGRGGGGEVGWAEEPQAMQPWRGGRGGGDYYLRPIL